jgi:hypothetical protein
MLDFSRPGVLWPTLATPGQLPVNLHRTLKKRGPEWVRKRPGVSFASKLPLLWAPLRIFIIFWHGRCNGRATIRGGARRPRVTAPAPSPTVADIVAALLTEPSLELAARAVGLSVPVLVQLASSPGPVGDGFKASRRAQAAIEAVRRAAYASHALDVLLALALDVEAPPAVRVGAASKILDLAAKDDESLLLGERLAAVEAIVVEAKGSR